MLYARRPPTSNHFYAWIVTLFITDYPIFSAKFLRKIENSLELADLAQQLSNGPARQAYLGISTLAGTRNDGYNDKFEHTPAASRLLPHA